MLALRKANDRGHFKNEWLDSYHTFSFGEYYDPKNMNYRDLRVINHDFINANSGFPMHGHRDMEIITYVLQGTIEHKDSMGNKAQVKPGEIQVMTAGTGVMHSEYNPDVKSLTEILQIWIVPDKRGLEPGYKQKMFSKDDKHNELLLIASPTGERDSMKIHQDVRLYAGSFDKGFQKRYEPREGRGIWIQVAKGSLLVNKQTLQAGDGVAIDKETLIRVEGNSESPAEFLLFDLK